MKKFSILLLVFIGVNLFSQEWKYIDATREGTIYYYKPNNDDTAWIKELSNKTEYYPENKIERKKIIDGYKIMLYKFNCSDRQLGLIQVTTYSKKEVKVLNSLRIKDYLVDMNYVIPDSIGESILTSFCSR